MSRLYCVVLALLLLMPSPARAAGGKAGATPGGQGMFADCERCHKPTGWKDIRPGARGGVAHARTGFPLVGRHGHIACVACHRPERDLGKPWPGACVACHQDRAHKGALGTDCARCHTAAGWKVPAGRRLHEDTRFPLTGAHLAAECAGCHRRADRAVYNDAPVACEACHLKAYRRRDIHPDHVSGSFSLDCARCHRTRTWAPARFLHASFFPLRGAHRPLGCEDCHGGARYGGTPTECVGCHRAQYDGTTAPDHRLSAFPLTCDDCHTVNAWKPVRPDWHDTLFPVTFGKHKKFDCADCHTTPGNFRLFRCTNCHTADKMIRKHDEVSSFVFDDRACYQCHPRGTEDD